MSEAKYTPGPWWETENGVRDRGGYICHMIPAHRYPGQDERFKKETAERAANKTLIAASPELLEALEAALVTIEDYLDYEHNGDPWVEDARAMGEMDINDYKRDGRLKKARAAIAKATGVNP